MKLYQSILLFLISIHYMYAILSFCAFQLLKTGQRVYPKKTYCTFKASQSVLPSLQHKTPLLRHLCSLATKWGSIPWLAFHLVGVCTNSNTSHKTKISSSQSHAVTLTVVLVIKMITLLGDELPVSSKDLNSLQVQFFLKRLPVTVA